VNTRGDWLAGKPACAELTTGTSNRTSNVVVGCNSSLLRSSCTPLSRGGAQAAKMRRRASAHRTILVPTVPNPFLSIIFPFVRRLKEGEGLSKQCYSHSVVCEFCVPSIVQIGVIHAREL